MYSTVFGEVEFKCIEKNAIYPIIVKVNDEQVESFTTDGKMLAGNDGECIIFPSREQRNWDLFTVPYFKKHKFDPNTLNPFDKVLARNYREEWLCTFFSHIVKDEDTYPYSCGYDMFTYCILYNDDTKHLVGTSDEAPEYYRYWEE